MKKFLSVTICLILLLGTVAFSYDGLVETIRADATTITEYKTGDIIEFGSYPQSEVTDSGLIKNLNSLAGDNKNWTSYEYYRAQNKEMELSDYMRYKDVEYKGQKYRGVIFDEYRTDCMDDTESYSGQESNGYYAGTVYWFKYEPIEWQVLDPSAGMIMSKIVLDSQPYTQKIYYGSENKAYYPSDYEKSSIREWLNDDFYNTAFSLAEKKIIKETELDNRDENQNGLYDSASTTDNIYLLSYNDVLNSDYGFDTSKEDSAGRQANVSEYAKCQGCDGDPCCWRLRTADGESITYNVYIGGAVDSFEQSTDGTTYGIRPALNLNSMADLNNSDNSDIDSTASSIEDSKTITTESVKDSSKDSDKDEDEEESNDADINVIILIILIVLISALVGAEIFLVNDIKKRPGGKNLFK